MDKDSSTIYMYNIVFSIGEATSPAMTLRVDAPVTVDKSGKVYTYAGTWHCGLHAARRPHGLPCPEMPIW